MTIRLGPGVWFVRSNRGNGSYPVTREGCMVVARFVLGMFGSGLLGWWLSTMAMAQGASWAGWVFPLVFLVGAAASAWYFITTARKHTDYTITATDYIESRDRR